MSGINLSVEIKRRVEDVYAFFLDLDRTVTPTDRMVQSVVKTPEGPVGAGTTFRIRQRSLGRVRDQMVHVLAVDPKRRIDFEAQFGPVRPLISLAFEATATGTLVVFRGDSRPIGPLKLVPFLTNRIGERNWSRRLRLTKMTLEGQADQRRE